MRDFLNDPYYSGWSDSASMLSDFEIGPEALLEATVLFAAYEGGYEGRALVFFVKERPSGELALYRASGSHCSCYGLEGQWDPEIYIPEQIERVEQVRSYQIEAYREFKEFREWVLENRDRFVRE